MATPSTVHSSPQTYEVMGFNISWYTGQLTPLASNPLMTTTSVLEALDPSDRFLFLTHPAGVEVYPIDTSTGLIGGIVAGSPFATGSTQSNANPSTVAFDSTGKFLFVINQGTESLSGGASAGGGIAEFTLNAITGAITTVAGSPVIGGANPAAIVIR